MGKLLVTNNPKVQEKLAKLIEVEYVDLELLDFFENVRNRIHQGAKLLTHPLSGSVKPGETPYKSVILEVEDSKVADFDSINLIENAIATSKKLMAHRNRSPRILTAQQQDDFQVIDLTLIMSVLPSMGIHVSSMIL